MPVEKEHYQPLVNNLEQRLITLELNQEQFKTDNLEMKSDLKQISKDVQEMKSQLARWGGVLAAVAAVATMFGVVVSNIKAWLGIMPVTH
jgi:hypothetical protein